MRKFFTLIAMAMLAMSVNAQTTIEFKGLLPSDFTYDATYYSETVWAETDADGNETGIKANAFTYLGGGTYSALELKEKNVKFNYKNTDQKDNFFILNRDYFTIGGKGAQLMIANVTRGQEVTLSIAPKEDDKAPSFTPSGVKLKGEFPALTKKAEFVSVTYTVTTTGEVALTNNDNGYQIASITIAEGEGGLSDNEPVFYAWEASFSQANKVTYSDGATLQITGNESKNISAGKAITIDGTPYTSMKVSNGAQNTFTLPEGKMTKKVTFYSYVNKAKTERDSYWKEVAGKDMDAETSGGIFENYSDPTGTPDKREYTLDAATNVVTFTNTGEQCCYVLVVEFYDESASVTSLENNDVQNDVIFNLAGQKVGNGFKGIAVKNGKKVVLK